MKRQYKNHEDTVSVMKEALWLAWQSSHVMGMGYLQDRPGATKEEVWAYVQWPDKPVMSIHADYVFGRMMKLFCRIDDNVLTTREGELRDDYQSWCNTFATYKDLLEKAEQNLQIVGETVG